MAFMLTLLSFMVSMLWQRAIAMTVTPVLMWRFADYDSSATVIPDAISGNDLYAMELKDNAVITDGVGLNCNGGFARTVGNIPSSLLGGSGAQPHSLEAKVKFSTINQYGTSPIALDSRYTTTGSYSHDQFDAIVFNEISNNKKYIAGSDYFRRTNKYMTGTGVVAETADTIEDFIHLVITYDPDAGLVTIYRNGEQYGDAYGPAGGFMTFDELTRALVCIRHQRTASLQGVVAGAAVYDQVLSSDEVADHYANFLVSDLCADVDCDDNDLCTDEYCDESTGECVYSDVDCTDADACTIDSCDPETGCVNDEMDCSNGNICDGEEACVEGECVTPDDFECPTNFLCDEDAQQCLRDCSLFAIDGYLTDCSVEFDEQASQLEEVGAALTDLNTFASALEDLIDENAANIAEGVAAFDLLKDEVADIAADVETNAASIVTNAGSISTNADAIGTNADNIDGNAGDIATNAASIITNAGAISTNVDDIGTNAENIGINADDIASNVETITAAVEVNAGSIGGLNESLAALKEIVDAFAPNADLGENSENSVGTETSSSSSGIFNVDLTEFTTKYNGELMVFLVTMNMMLLMALVILGIFYCRSDKSRRYAPVQMYATTDDENVQLKQ